MRSPYCHCEERSDVAIPLPPPAPVRPEPVEGVCGAPPVQPCRNPLPSPPVGEGPGVRAAPTRRPRSSGACRRSMRSPACPAMSESTPLSPRGRGAGGEGSTHPPPPLIRSLSKDHPEPLPSLRGASATWQSRSLPRPNILLILSIHVEVAPLSPRGRGAGGEGRTHY